MENGRMSIMVKMNKYPRPKVFSRGFCYVLGVVVNIYAEK